MIFTVRLNGTSENPFHKLGLKQNPFPQIAKYEYTGRMLALESLGGDPIPNQQYIKDKLKGCSKELIELCCSQFKPGEMVQFDVEFKE